MKLRHYEKSFDCWHVEGTSHLHISLIASKGRDIDDLLQNAEISVEDWHGNEREPIELGSLPKKDFDRVVRLFAEFLAEA